MSFTPVGASGSVSGAAKTEGQGVATVGSCTLGTGRGGEQLLRAGAAVHLLVRGPPPSRGEVNGLVLVPQSRRIWRLGAQGNLIKHGPWRTSHIGTSFSGTRCFNVYRPTPLYDDRWLKSTSHSEISHHVCVSTS